MAAILIPSRIKQQEVNPADVKASQIRACYQPILDLESLDIQGYEVLGRMEIGGQLQTLGPIFHNGSQDKLHIAQLISIDNAIQEMAIANLKESGKKTNLFINIMPNLLSRQHSNMEIRADRFHIINMVHKYDLDPEQIVIEITEDQFEGDITRLIQIVAMYKKSGFRIAVDDVGAGMSDLSRIAYIHPDIIKVDLQLLRNSMNSKSFRQVLQGVAFMAHRLGASLLFEGIEKEEELLVSLKMGGRFLQGFYFSPAEESFQDRTRFRSLLEEKLSDFSILRKAELMHSFQIRDALIGQAHNATQEINPADLETINSTILSCLHKLPENTRRMVLYDRSGYQISATFERDDQDSWIRESAEIGSNRFWDPMFLQTLAMKEYSGKPWNVSEPYYDFNKDTPYINVALVKGDDAVLLLQMVWDI